MDGSRGELSKDTVNASLAVVRCERKRSQSKGMATVPEAYRRHSSDYAWLELLVNIDARRVSGAWWQLPSSHSDHTALTIVHASSRDEPCKGTPCTARRTMAWFSVLDSPNHVLPCHH